MSGLLLTKKLQQGLDQLDIDVNEAIQARMLDYLRLIQKWDQVYNLTAIKQLPEMVSKHLLDSLVLQPHLTGQYFIDVGTGAGLPGIPLALAMPDCRFILLDSNGKRTRFLTHVRQQLAIDNIEIIHSRIELYQPESLFDGVISRAFAELDKGLLSSSHVCAADGYFWCMTGEYPRAELARLPTNFRLCQTIELAVPFLDEQRHLLCLQCR